MSIVPGRAGPGVYSIRNRRVAMKLSDVKEHPKLKDKNDY